MLHQRSYRILVVAFTLVIATFLGPRAAWAQPPPPSQKLGVLGLEFADSGSAESQERTARLAKALTEGLRERAGLGQGGYVIVPGANKELAEMKLLGDCFDERKECMADMAKSLGVQVLLFGKLEKRRTGYAVTLRRLDATRRAVVKVVNQEVAFKRASDDEMTLVAADLYAEVMELPREAVLTVRANSSTGQVFLDGDPVANLSDGEVVLRNVPAGTHPIAIEAPGFLRWEGEVVVEAGAAQRVDVTLVPAPPPPVASSADGEGSMSSASGHGPWKALTWTGTALTVGSLVGVVYAGLKVGSLEGDKEDAIRASFSDPNAPNAGTPMAGIRGQSACDEADAANYAPVSDVCSDGKRYATMTNVFIGASAGFAVLTGVFAYKAYFSGKDEPELRTRAGRVGNALTPSVRVTPQVYSEGGGGLDVLVRF